MRYYFIYERIILVVVLKEIFQGIKEGSQEIDNLGEDYSSLVLGGRSRGIEQWWNLGRFLKVELIGWIKRGVMDDCQVFGLINWDEGVIG